MTKPDPLHVLADVLKIPTDAVSLSSVTQAVTNLQCYADEAENLAWNALGRPGGTYETTNVQRLAEDHKSMRDRGGDVLTAIEAIIRKAGWTGQLSAVQWIEGLASMAMRTAAAEEIVKTHKPSSGLARVMEELRSQEAQYGPAHDDAHTDEKLLVAAFNLLDRVLSGGESGIDTWGLAKKFPDDGKRLAIVAALVISELNRRDRAGLLRVKPVGPVGDNPEFPDGTKEST